MILFYFPIIYGIHTLYINEIYAICKIKLIFRPNRYNLCLIICEFYLLYARLLRKMDSIDLMCECVCCILCYVLSCVSRLFSSIKIKLSKC